jgi:hypothetical protein
MGKGEDLLSDCDNKNGKTIVPVESSDLKSSILFVGLAGGGGEAQRIPNIKMISPIHVE